VVENQPIDVELVPNDGALERRAPDPPAPTPGLLDAERGRLAVVAAAALLVGAALGWAGRGSSSDDAVPPATTRTTVARPTETTIGDVLPEPEAPPTTRFRPIIAAPPTTTSGASEMVAVSSVEIPDRLADVAAELVVTVRRATLFTLDLPTATLSERDVDRQPFGPPTLYAGDGWVLLPSWDDELPSTLIRDDEPPVGVDLGTAWELVGVAGSDTFWRVDKGLTTGRRGSVALIDVAGSPLGPVVELSQFPLLGDPGGGVFVEVAGDTFQVTPDGADRLTTGELLGASAAHAVVHECDDTLACSYRLVDRMTGERVDIPPAESRGVGTDLNRPWWTPGGALLSPDGDALVTLSFERDDEGRFRESLGVLELTTGEFTEFAVNRDLTPLVWSPDGAFVFYVDGGRLFAFDRAAGDSFDVLPELVGVDTVAIRSSAG
jgi:hypothetical protein